MVRNLKRQRKLQTPLTVKIPLNIGDEKWTKRVSFEFYPPVRDCQEEWECEIIKENEFLKINGSNYPCRKYDEPEHNIYFKLNILNIYDKKIFSSMYFDSNSLFFKFNVKMDENIAAGKTLNLHIYFGWAYWSPIDLELRPNNQENVDLETVVENGTPTNLVLKTMDGDIGCHLDVLQKNCHYFEQLLNGKPDVQELESDSLEKFDKAAVKDFLFYIYTRKIPPNIEETCFNLIEVASLTSELDLKLMCDFTMSHILSLNNFLQVYDKVEKFHLKNLEEVFVNFVIENYKDVEKLDNWKDIDEARGKKLLFLICKHSAYGKVCDCDDYQDESY